MLIIKAADPIPQSDLLQVGAEGVGRITRNASGRNVSPVPREGNGPTGHWSADLSPHQVKELHKKAMSTAQEPDAIHKVQVVASGQIWKVQYTTQCKPRQSR